MMFLGHHDWTINFCNDYYCWHFYKRIDIDLSYDGDVKQIILHEIAHIDTAKYCNQKHNPAFWKKLEYLTWKFLKTDLDEHQKKHKEYMSVGYYSLKYADVAQGLEHQPDKLGVGGSNPPISTASAVKPRFFYNKSTLLYGFSCVSGKNRLNV